jgi:hypothetical protein
VITMHVRRRHHPDETVSLSFSNDVGRVNSQWDFKLRTNKYKGVVGGVI